jgi:hypothetical protein
VYDIKGSGIITQVTTYVVHTTFCLNFKGRELWFDFPQGQEIFHFLIAFSPALGPTQPPIKWVPGAVPLEVKRQELEADHSPPSSAEVKNGGDIFPLSVRLHGVVPN